ncbi:MAG TPA: non-heme iron oxygenase ferredoxin subunit [Pedomonas sp.]|uniref:non-heme iron oxygenase ferredoxin subunit n=1 Tax=Pedomonas sp. TaxID=2976421 RepID=UPI002F3FC923
MPWIPTLPPTALADEGVAGAVAGKVRVALYQVDDAFYATALMCTHGQASLADGYLDGCLIECPLHQGTFDVRTGAPMSEPCTEAVRSFPTKLEDGLIHVLVNDDEV